MIDEVTFYRYVDKAFKLDIDEKNQIYFKISELMDQSLNPQVAASEILALFENILNQRKNDFCAESVEKAEGKIPGGIFRRIG